MARNNKTFKPVVSASPHYDQIMRNFDIYGNKLNHADFWRQFVRDVDPNIKQKTWASFVRRYRKQQEKKELTAPVTTAPAVVKTVPKDSDVTLDQLEENSIEYMMTVGVNALKELAENPEVAKKIPTKDRVNLLRDAIKLKTSRETLDLKRRKDDREQSLFEEIMESAQYGEAEEGEIIDADVEEIEEEEAPQLEEPKSVPHVEVLQSIVFDPSQIS